VRALLSRFPGLCGIPHVDLGVRPTRVDERVIGGLGVLVKRDDETSPAYGGNKVRCLEYLLALPAKRLLTFSTLGAHHAYATALHGKRIGLETDVVLVRKGKRGELRDKLGEVASRVVESDGMLSAAFAGLVLWQRGTRIVPPGGVCARGALGYADAALELDEVPRRIYVPLGTGTTVSGLLAGLMLREAETEVIAVDVVHSVLNTGPVLWRRAFAALNLLRRYDEAVPRIARGRVTLRVEEAEGDYGEETDAARAALEAGGDLPLEGVYTAKTLAVLLRERPERAMLVATYAGDLHSR